VQGASTTPGLVVYRFGAPLFYANANRFSEEVRRLVASPRSPLSWLVVDGGPITNVDYTAARVILRLHDDLARQGVKMAFAHVPPELRADLDRHHVTEAIGSAFLFDTLHEALAMLGRRCT
jgi:sulfate permease, SulP family